MQLEDYSIKEIQIYLKDKKPTEELIDQLSRDSRKGVQELAKKYRRLKNRQARKLKVWHEYNQKQLALKEEGYQLVAGIDEAGRGPLAGPVVAAAVILNPGIQIIGLDDSKKLSAKEREQLYTEIKEKAIAISTGIIDNNIIDKINILQATFMAMRQAIEELSTEPEYILVDGNRIIPKIGITQEAIIDGDCKVNAIAAASIIAKVTRDQIIDDYHKQYPEYGFIRNKGYGTSEHINALKNYGPTPIHRFSFSIVDKYHFKKHKDNLLAATTESELYQLGNEIGKTSYFSQENLAKLRKVYQKQFRKLSQD